MGSDIILCMALIASFAFVIQFLLSILGSDLDTDFSRGCDRVVFLYRFVLRI